MSVKKLKFSRKQRLPTFLLLLALLLEWSTAGSWCSTSTFLVVELVRASPTPSPAFVVCGTRSRVDFFNPSHTISSKTKKPSRCAYAASLLRASSLATPEFLLLGHQQFNAGAAESTATAITSTADIVSSLSAITTSAISTTASTFLLATIDSDIAKMSDNEFAPVFLGGITVMFGGLLSALMVGFILENKNLYARIVADSYIQQQRQQGGNDPNNLDNSDDELFWKGLSEEEKKKTQELLERLRIAKIGGTTAGSSDGDKISTTIVNDKNGSVVDVTTTSIVSPTTTTSSGSSRPSSVMVTDVMKEQPLLMNEGNQQQDSTKKKKGMFDDYA